jgi:hypothetical protein
LIRQRIKEEKKKGVEEEVEEGEKRKREGGEEWRGDEKGRKIDRKNNENYLFDYTANTEIYT